MSETFLCDRHDERHPLQEFGYGWPDAVFAHGLPASEKERLTALRNEDFMLVGEGHFVRGWAPIPVQQRAGEWGLGLWVRVASADSVSGTIANQGLYGAPTL